MNGVEVFFAQRLNEGFHFLLIGKRKSVTEELAVFFFIEDFLRSSGNGFVSIFKFQVLKNVFLEKIHHVFLAYIEVPNLDAQGGGGIGIFLFVVYE